MNSNKAIKKNNDLVSVIIPVYNTAKYLKECINSVAKQTYNNLEIICIDDGSTDESMQILEEYKKIDTRITIYSTKGRKGAGVARNIGLKHASGSYCCFLDSDDFFKPNFISSMYHQITITDSDVCVCNMCILDDKNKAFINSGINAKNVPDMQTFHYKDIERDVFSLLRNEPWTKMFNMEFIKKYNLEFQELMRTNDLLFTISAILNADKITFINKRLVVLRRGHGFHSQSTNHMYSNDFYLALLGVKKQLIELNIYEELRQDYINYAAKTSIYNLENQNNYMSYTALFDKCKTEIFNDLDIANKSAGFFYNLKIYNKIDCILEKDSGEYLYKLVNDKILAIDSCNAKIEKQKKAKRKIQNSKEYKIGLIIIWLPRKIKKALRSIKSRFTS